MAGVKMTSEFFKALQELENEKGIKVDVVIDSIEMALVSAYKKHYGASENVRAEVNRVTGESHIYFRKTVVEEVENPNDEISLEEACTMDPDFEVGDIFESEVTPASFGRIAAQTAKQVVVQRIREAERDVVYDKFIGSEGDIVNGVVTRIENGNIFIAMDKTEGLLPVSEQIPGEVINVGDHVKVYILEVKKTSRGAQVIMSRSNVGLLRRLLETEVPEIYDGTIEVKTCVREAGERAKVAVYSTNEAVDPIGACVGAKGMRIQNISNELNGEKVEVIRWSINPAEYITAALSPSKVVSVDIDETKHFARVIVPDYQLSLAIGKSGQNARLAVRLTGWKIDIKSESQAAALEEQAALNEDETLAEEVTENLNEVAEEVAEEINE